MKTDEFWSGVYFITANIYIIGMLLAEERVILLTMAAGAIGFLFISGVSRP